MATKQQSRCTRNWGLEKMCFTSTFFPAKTVPNLYIERWTKRNSYMKMFSALLIFSVCLAANAGAATSNLADMTFKRSWSSGSKDAAGKEVNATEVMHLVPHGGKLYAATSQWMESDSKTPKVT